MICYPFKSVGRGFNLAGVLREFAVVIAQSLGDISAYHKGAQKSFQFSTYLWPLPNAKWQADLLTILGRATPLPPSVSNLLNLI